MKNNLPIGVFDSGLGGLTVVKQIKKFLPNEDIVYLGDTARVPYGTRSKETIVKFSLQDAKFLLSKKVKCIVIACNTSSALAGDVLKKKFKIPVFDVIGPTLKEAQNVSGSGRIGVIGTRGTINSGAYKVKFSKACPLFVSFIEEGEIKSPALKIIVKDYLSYFKSNKIGTLIMGCTHYPIISDIIEKEVGKNVKIIDPGVCVSKEVKTFLSKHNMLNIQKAKSLPAGSQGKNEYYVTDLTERFTKVAKMFLGEEIKGKINRVSLD